MKKLLFIPLILFFYLRLSALTAYYYYAIFYDVEFKPYVETYFSILGNTIKYKQNENGLYQGYVEISLIFKQDGQIKKDEKIIVRSPAEADTINRSPFLFVHRFYIDPGIYNLEIILRDTLSNNKEAENRFFDILTIQNLSDTIQFSNVEFLEKSVPTSEETVFTKNGNNLFPYVSDFFPKSVNTIMAYIEVYNMHKYDDEFIFRYFISKVNQKGVYNQYNAFKKIKTNRIVPLICSFDISELPSGNYYLNFEIINKENKVVTNQKVFFQRSNPEQDKKNSTIDELIKGSFVEFITNIDTLKEYIRCLIPICDQVELDKALSVLNKADTLEMKRYILSFWRKRNPLEPEIEWNKYKAQVNLVNKLYGSKVKKGYESDRGRVYLKYGPPDHIIESKHEPSAYPYEIWQYYVIGNQLNKKFVFYNPMLVGNDYLLLHSDVRGEIYDKNWERRLSSRNNSMYNFNATQSDEQYGGRAGENFNK